MATPDFDSFVESLTEIRDGLVGPLVLTDEWLGWTVEEQIALRTVVDMGQALFERVLRPKFDNAQYAGKTKAGVKSIRNKGEYSSAPGRKAATPTAEEILARAMQR